MQPNSCLSYLYRTIPWFCPIWSFLVLMFCVWSYALLGFSLSLITKRLYLVFSWSYFVFLMLGVAVRGPFWFLGLVCTIMGLCRQDWFWGFTSGAFWVKVVCFVGGLADGLVLGGTDTGFCGGEALPSEYKLYFW